MPVYWKYFAYKWEIRTEL